MWYKGSTVYLLPDTNTYCGSVIFCIVLQNIWSDYFYYYFWKVIDIDKNKINFLKNLIFIKLKSRIYIFPIKGENGKFYIYIDIYTAEPR